MADLDGEQSDLAGCLKLVSIIPGLLDLAESQEGSVSLLGEGITPDSLKDMLCQLSKEEKSIAVVSVDVGEDVAELSFVLPEETGHYHLSCRTPDFREQLDVVDTSALRLTSIQPSEIFTWSQQQVVLEVGELSGPAAILCFCSGATGDVYQRWTALHQGSPLRATVICPDLVLVTPGQYDCGVAYSLSAKKSAKTVKLMGNALSPKPVNASFSPDSSTVRITFDQNLEEVDVQNCKSIFNENSLRVFGKDPECEIVSNQILVHVIDRSALSKTVLEFKDSVRTKFSQLAVEGSHRIDFREYQMVGGEETAVMVGGDDRNCNDHIGTGEQDTQALPANQSNIPLGQRQRLNMMLWRVNRSNRGTPHKNSTTAGKSEAMQTNGTGKVWAHLRGPTELDLASDAVYIASLRACGQSPPRLDTFIWEVRRQNGDSLDTALQNGPILHIDGAMLQPYTDYNVIVKILLGDVILGADEIKLRTKLGRLELKLPVTHIVVGTGHPIEIDGSSSSSLDRRLVKFEWSCIKGYCYEPGKEKKPLNEQQSLSQPILFLPSKTLAIGRYVFELEGESGGVKDQSYVAVQVIAGEPPLFGPLRLPQLDLGREEMTVRLRVAEIRAPCQLSWQSVPAVGLGYIPLNQSDVKVKGTPHVPFNLEMKLKLPTSLLTPGAKYKFRCVADCGRFAQSQFEFQMKIPQKHPKFKLLVEPSKGSSIKTKFIYKLLSNSKKNGNPAGYLFSYGFEENGIAKFLHSNHDRNFTTVLGRGTYRTTVRACRTKLDCITILGPEITTSTTANFSEEEIKELYQTYAELLLSTRFSEGHNFLEMIVPAVKENGEISYNNFSAEIEAFLLRRIETFTERLKTDRTSLPDCVKLLDSATYALSLLKNTHEFLDSILKFRDLIHQLLTEDETATNLIVEHRMEKMKVRPKRKATVEKIENMINVLLNTASSVQNLTNSTEEKYKLLLYAVHYGAQLCNVLEESPFKKAGNLTDLIFITSERIKPDKMKKKIQFPQGLEAQYSNITGWAKVNLTKDNASEGFCFTSAYLRDDILSQVSIIKDNNLQRYGPIFWLNWLPYKDKKILLVNYSSLIPEYNHSTNSLESRPITGGNITLTLPLWNDQKLNGTILKCSRFVNNTWDLNECTTYNSTTPGSIFCACPFPGFYSVFGITKNGTSATDQHKPSTPKTVELNNPTNNVSTSQNSADKSTLTTNSVEVTNNSNHMVTLKPAGQSSGTATPAVGIPSSTSPLDPHTPTGVTVTNQKPVILTRDPKYIDPTLHANTEIPATTETTSLQLQRDHHYTNNAFFLLNESYIEKVQKNEKNFSSNLEKQLKANLNISAPVLVESESGKIKVMLLIDEKEMPGIREQIDSLDSSLKNGTLLLFGLNKEILCVPTQGLVYHWSHPITAQTSAALVPIMCFAVAILIGAFAITIYLRSAGEQRSIRLVQDMFDEAAPKYLRLHDSVSLGGSGPSTPSLVNEMESSLAVLTKTRGRGYESVDNFSNLPGNI